MTGVDFLVNTSTSKGYKLNLQTGLFINNEFVAGAKTIDTVNPATGEVIASVQAAEKKQVDDAVDAAENAFNNVWSKTTPQERQRLINKLADLIERDTEELAQIETLDNGKGISMSRNVDVPGIVASLRYYAGFADKVHGKTIDTPGAFSYTRHEAIGVCAAIIPWNFPLMMLGWKLGPCLATGNVIIVKTSELTPLSALKVATLAKEAGFPPGVINIITGYGAEAGDALARHQKVGKVAFTGSTLVGRLIMKAAAESNLKKVTLELGGKSPNIIFDDADLDKAVRWAHFGIFFNHGQCCCAGSRVYVQEGIYDKFLEKFKERTEQTRVGDPFDETTFQGPQISQTQYDRIMGYIEQGKTEGATVYAGGSRHGDKGYFIQPTIFTDATPKMKIVQEEIFGPVVVITKFKDTEEVIKLAHDTTYGLAAAVFTENVTRAVEVSNRLEAGTVWVNCYNQLDTSSPFGGYRQSGIGRENGEYALDNYLQVKTVKININRDV
ncbi:aldehyde dehydrogenase domain-containing protein [Halteromyces radiatus]|uniref:aldehyde dehydrogenase domain-containing protein n=1 Tax=Halteromyces radiatus TaxID=101107 RepID=UPI0022200EC6|nr:aldehyde dehydrogenase domain-containing protein [Halteromyces radiatus]KAI8085214.1 aldehyde dehydrogenase domain-containing protein [Halteromyces radiatus]